MKKNLLALSLFAFCTALSAQQIPTLLPNFRIQSWEKTAGADGSQPAIVRTLSRENASELGIAGFDPALKPFYHGVASGDPLENGVIIWTRITPEANNDPITVTWQMATDPQLTNIIQTGTSTTNADQDFTVKVDVANLQPATTYYYNFTAPDGSTSLTGRTRTARTTNTPTDHLRFGVASCSHYAQGYFNAYGRLADRNDLEAVIHLGDYIYEYGNTGGFVGSVRPMEPDYEITSLPDYRTRHSLYKLDPNLIRLHQQHAFIAVWDDHEVANNAWQNGAENHDSATEGNYADRKSAGERAYFEWMPIRNPQAGQPYKVERTIHYGNLMDLIMIDTRHEGREEQIPIDSAETNNPNRTILGTEQYEWFTNELANSTAQWKVIGNQVVFTPINTFDLLGNDDMWDGYPAERQKIKNLIDSLAIKDIVVLTGDIHIGIAADVTLVPNTEYNPATGETAFGVEFVTASISSSNDEALTGLPFTLEQLQGVALGLNPQAKYLNLIDHGYFILDVTPNRAQADWYVIDTKLTPSNNESIDTSLYTVTQVPHLLGGVAPAPSLPNPPDPAPNYTAIENPNKPQSNLAVLGVYPNPIDQVGQIHYALAKPMQVTISLFDQNGKLVHQLINQQQGAGVYDIKFDAAVLPAGTYICQISTPEGSTSRKIVVTK
jgi:alkaline phosphatase D